MNVSIEEDLVAEGEPEPEFNPGIAARLPRKIIAGGALIRDAAGRILFVEPNYKPFLDIPGGIAEANESPLQACRREVVEELQLDLHIDRTLVVDWTPAHGVWGDTIQFVYDGGVLTPEQIEAIRLPNDELASIRFLTLDEATPNLRPSMVRRIAEALHALNKGDVRYAEFGRLP
ncbi:NUDIX hydrolase [Longispora fulva]|uniref:ADP-ribose pyrophosphatase YjhB (NUDIX family) n=1 Tax=Longispora fulva TaxID=619741 RepID=A0A8J7GJI1_9ACTN|nr:NUDIX hydrolase [Longispora fulva]MBG6139286.1 ADP-ribose pyrophosphatase YjhB (NUDIX family) [Longispora fulva]GIG58780.1 NUDIX hydrolase [Longispora fulva]